MYNNINISPEFSKLKNIKNLYINLFDTTDIKSFSNLENLQILSISITNTILPIPIETNHMDLSHISLLKNLYSLSLYSVSILNLDSISLLTNLTELELLTPRLLSIKPIHNLIKIKYLKIKSPNILDLDPLINLINLEDLSIISKGLKNISSISNLKKLISFECETNNNLDLVPIFVLKNSIVNLNLSCCRFFNLASLTFLKKLKTLKLLSTIESVFILNLNKNDYRNKNIRSSCYYHTLDFLDVMSNIIQSKTGI
jgi:internalin A